MPNISILVHRINNNTAFARADFETLADQHGFRFRHIAFYHLTEQGPCPLVYGPSTLITRNGAAEMCKGVNNAYAYKAIGMPEHDAAAYQQWLTATEGWQEPAILMSSPDIGHKTRVLNADGTPGFTTLKNPQWTSYTGVTGTPVYALSLRSKALLELNPSCITLEVDRRNDEEFTFLENGSILITRDEKAYRYEYAPTGVTLTEVDLATVKYREAGAALLWCTIHEKPEHELELSVTREIASTKALP